MQAKLYPRLADALLLMQTVAHHSDVRATLSGAGYTESIHNAGQQLTTRVHEALEDIHARLQSDQSALHLIHSSTTELEMWLQSARLRARRVLLNEEEVSVTVGSHLHGPDHTLTVMIQAQRFLSLMRTDTELAASLGNKRSVQDLLQRGFALQQQLWRCADDAANPEGTDAAQITSGLAHELDTWVQGAYQAAARALHDQPRILGMLGHTPDHLSTPLGGVASHVTRHQRTQGQAPQGGTSPDAPGWSVGRQGRNKLNHGEGYT